MNRLVEANDEALNMEVVYATDDEGNGFDIVGFTPALGNYDGEDFRDECQMEEDDEVELNAICVN